MKQILLSFFLAVFVFSSTVEAQQHRTSAKTSTAKRSASVSDIRDCPDEGRGGDPDLNRRKNIRSDNRERLCKRFSG
jgi:hypothetical protein